MQENGFGTTASTIIIIIVFAHCRYERVFFNSIVKVMECCKIETDVAWHGAQTISRNLTFTLVCFALNNYAISRHVPYRKHHSTNYCKLYTMYENENSNKFVLETK